MNEASTSEKRILIVEDGDEYERFARLFLADACRLLTAHSAKEALAVLAANSADGFLMDLRFDRAPESVLAGDIEGTAERLFGRDRTEAVRYLKEHQGTLILAEIRKAGHRARAVFIHDFPSRRLENLRRLYGDVVSFPSFDAAQIRKVFGLYP